MHGWNQRAADKLKPAEGKDCLNGRHDFCDITDAKSLIGLIKGHTYEKYHMHETERTTREVPY